MRLAIIDYGAGNTKSVQFAFERLGINPVLTADKAVLQNSDGVIFPGVGNAEHAMRNLKQSGLDEIIPGLKQPVLGICLGMQLLCDSSAEGNTKGLFILPDKVEKFKVDLKIPQIGWNEVDQLKGDLFKGIEEGTHFYFVHSYYVPLSDNAVAVTNYGVDYCSAIQKDNFYGCQFHPEKSGEQGARVLQNFIDLCE